MRTWKCRGCGREVQLEQEDMATGGKPICGVLAAEPPAKPQIKLIIQMYGDAIERVFQDSCEAQVTDIIFTEDAKYLDGSYDCDKKGKLLFPVTSGPLKGQGVCSHFDGVAFGGARMFAPVVRAAEARKAARKARGRQRPS